jgi:hypothetical protein
MSNHHAEAIVASALSLEAAIGLSGPVALHRATYLEPAMPPNAASSNKVVPRTTGPAIAICLRYRWRRRRRMTINLASKLICTFVSTSPAWN